ncbi:gamma-glutamylcyclotransferase-like isoform X2 [Monomorium pharaonis]|uniref:gamma-glutamylcyclotransferase n=2 Tax=Monomorium pharaonis TaxID=307658 RepID=UPI00063FBFAD|nr:gamma-glutamylcyclotransferase [Monomorium pharaonis]XP_036151181.1 gamma-glutamylcyclotransferase-like isoform X2 [Monomorium pharaonis]
MSNTFLYFAYGSNLFTKRIRLDNPTAVMKHIGYIKNFRLDFNRYSKRWRGTSATIVETENSVVWGVVWELHKCNLATLDCQESVQDNIYRAMSVNVETPDGRTLNCRVYQQCNNPKEYIKPEDFPIDKRPSPLYLNMILRGAEENNLPFEYIKFLKTIPHNGYEGEYDISLSLTEN